MLSSLEPMQEVDDREELAPPLSRYQAFSRFCVAHLDVYTRGHAAEAMRALSFLVVGGLGALVNLACVWVFSSFTPLPDAADIVLATEIALLFNFLLNDRFTFHALVDSRRPFWLRCVRFHGPSALGFVLTLVISLVAHEELHLSSVVAQAIAILIVTVVNFLMHRLWTYRAVATHPQGQPAH
ncbi:MAG TPA: GtrA family protein [Ktedonobacterales bacterium]|nr:GtrA family protein [Ktedonobacterales bacterium]